ncbi:MAG: tRNA CCA-pyrophosphorylase [Nitrospirae bacterium]|nr:MAG: tRNA CCA-pyrophosphorylase [Nitrospirota bacterium]
MKEFKEYLEVGLKFHGHRCPAMPMGLKAGLYAMQLLGVERAKDGQLQAIVELDENHCATCFADGVQVATGCTYGKGNIKRTGYGKWGLTLIDKKTSRAVRVVPKAEVMQKNKETEFMKMRKSGVPASQVPEEVVQPLFESVVNAPPEQIFNHSEVFQYEWKDEPHTFDTIVCSSCGEMVVERNARVKGGQVVCIPCSGYGK